MQVRIGVFNFWLYLFTEYILISWQKEKWQADNFSLHNWPTYLQHIGLDHGHVNIMSFSSFNIIGSLHAGTEMLLKDNAEWTLSAIWHVAPRCTVYD